MTAVGFKVSVLVVLSVEIGTQVVIVLDKEVGLANTYPEEVGILTEQTVNFGIAVGINLRMASAIGLLLVYRSRQQADLATEVRVLDTDEQAVEHAR